MFAMHYEESKSFVHGDRMSFRSVWRKEKWRITALIFVLSLTFCATAYLWFRAVPLSVSAVTTRVNSVVDDVIVARKDAMLNTDDVPFGDVDTINVLVLGIDSRKEGTEQHCDAIHMVSINVKSWTVLVTSVPRGTYAYIPGDWKENEYYLANACAFAGLDYGVEQIEHIVGVKADYVATVGFSETLGILRSLELPTTESLQWLRHRQSYAIGDPQRSQNQAVFMKDVAVKLLVGDGISSLFFHLLYSFVHTDMPEATARALYDGLLLHGIGARPDDIVLTMKPHFDVQDLHFDPEHASEQVDALLAKLQGRLSRFDLSNRSLEEVQTDLVEYLTSSIATGQDLQEIMDGQLWLQVEDTATRESLQYQFVELQARRLNDADHQAAVQLIADYILEKQTEGLLVWEDKGRALLATYVDR
jgi:hypothetical protein